MIYLVVSCILLILFIIYYVLYVKNVYIKDEHNSYYISNFVDKMNAIEEAKNKFENEVEMNPSKLVKIVKLFDEEICNLMIHEAEVFAKENGWTQQRHEAYPTTDFELHNLDYSYSQVMYMVYKKIIPEMAIMFNIKEISLFLSDLFFVRYTHKRQNKLKKHKDGSLYSFILTLNNDFANGGTLINNTIYKPNIGEVLIFCGQNEHSGIGISNGVRYIITGFLNIT